MWLFSFDNNRGFLKLALVSIVILFGIFGVSLFNSHPVSAAGETFDTETNPENLFRAIKYYRAIEFCANTNAGDFKETISGEDIDSGPRWWVSSTKNINIGVAIDSFGDQDGLSDCSGGSGGDNGGPWWIDAAFQFFGFNPDGGKDTLEDLGYSCNVSSGTYECKNPDINDTIVDTIKNSPYLKNTSIANASSKYYDVATYWGAFKTITQTCGATAGGNTNLVTMKTYQANGTTKQQQWSVGSASSVRASINPIESVTEGNTASCRGTLVQAVNDNVDAYQQWANEQVCRETYTSLSSDATTMSWCAKGRSNQNNVTYCLSAPVGYSAGVGYDYRHACFIGAGQPTDSTGKTLGELCMALPSLGGNASLIGACINGGLHKNDTNYCSATYPAPDALNQGGVLPNDTNKAARDACIKGQAMKVSGGGTVLGNGTVTGGDADGGTGDTASCVIDGWGWLICPAISFLATIADGAFSFLSTSFLQIHVDILSTESGTYRAWLVMRDIANVAFVIAFLFIIFSQLTGAGVSNYGIKKMLPRLIIAAILVNISFFVCQLAVDASNILGKSIKDVFDAIGDGVTGAQYSVGDESGNWLGIAAGVIAGASVAWGLGVAILLPVLIGAVIALAMIFLILIIRQALIVLLIVISPIAFVAYLLPNTEQWFTKWRKVFVALLLVFPLVGLLFGAASLTSGILKSVYAGTGDSIQQIVAAGVLVLPLFLLPSLLKGSLKATGALGAKLSGYTDSLSKRGKSGVANTGLVKNYAANRAQRKAAISTGSYKGNNPISYLRSRGNRRLNQAGWFNKATGGYGAERTIAGQGQERKDAQEAMAMFGGDDGLVAAWAASGGDVLKIPKEFKLNPAQLAQFNLLKNAGHAKKATSFTAAAQYLSENGKGNAEAFASALGTAANLGASETDISNAWETGVAAYRKSGRGDAIGELNAFKDANGGAPMINGAAREEFRSTGSQALATARAKAWQEVGASSVHREGIKPKFDKDGKFDAEKSGGYISYQQHLVTNAENTRAALAGFDSMEARAKAIAEEPILKAARHHQEDATGTPSTIKSIQEAKTYFNIK